MTKSLALRATTVVVRALLIAAICLTVFVAYGLANNAWYHVLAVRGGSMEPAITAGDMIVITRPPARIEVGQVLTLQVDGAIVTHRVVEVKPDGTFVTQGDANDSRDDFTANDVRIVGEYRFSLPLIGMLIDPLISGAWFAQDSPTQGTAGSGTWESASSLVSSDPATGRLTWSPPPVETVEPEPSAAAEEPSPSPSPSAPLASDVPSPAAEGDPPPDSVTPSRMPERVPTPEPTPGGDPSPPETPAPSETPPPSPAATPSESPTPSPTPEATETPEPAPSGTL